jgi:hypothetical protein
MFGPMVAIHRNILTLTYAHTICNTNHPCIFTPQAVSSVQSFGSVEAHQTDEKTFSYSTMILKTKEHVVVLAAAGQNC